MNFLDPRLPDRFWSKVQPCPMSGCWLWVGAESDGYGQMRVGDRVLMTHRIIVESVGRRIPAGLTVDHRCEVTLCCNPLHLDVVSNAENIARYWERHPLTHCRHGHDLAASGVYRTSYRGRTEQRCRACHKADMRDYQRRRRLLEDHA
jgi:hypothetical protein